jgi:hypothetical protein
MGERDTGGVAEQLTATLARLGRRPDAEVEEARDAVRGVLELHGAGLARVLDLAREAAGPALVATLAADPLVGHLLALHGLHPVALDARVRDAVDRLTRRERAVTLVELAPDAVRVRLSPAGDVADTARLTRLVEDALCEAAPDAPPLVIDAVPSPRGLVPVTRLLEGRPAAIAPTPLPERCDHCGAPLAAGHGHLVDPAARQLACACPDCLGALGAPGAGPLRAVVHRVEALPELRLDDARWAELELPVDLAFFVKSSAEGRVLALYPGPTGVAESRLPLHAWDAVVADNPALAALQPDVEALLVHRVRGTRDHHRVSIDVAYALVGLLRKQWRGLSGGAEARRAVADFFLRLGAERAPEAGPPCRA